MGNFPPFGTGKFPTAIILLPLAPSPPDCVLGLACQPRNLFPLLVFLCHQSAGVSRGMGDEAARLGECGNCWKLGHVFRQQVALSRILNVIPQGGREEGGLGGDSRTLNVAIYLGGFQRSRRSRSLDSPGEQGIKYVLVDASGSQSVTWSLGRFLELVNLTLRVIMYSTNRTCHQGTLSRHSSRTPSGCW